MQSNNPSIIRQVYYCPHCGNTAPQRLVHVQHYLERAWLSDGSEDKTPWGTFVAICETCDHVLLYDNTGDIWKPEEFHKADLLYPESGYLHASVPSSIAKIYEEAHRVMQRAPNAYAVQIRRALEAICEDRGATKGPLQTKLKELSDKGELPPALSEASNVLRLFGNIGAHGIRKSVHPLQVIVLDKFFRAIVEYVYIAPRRLKEFKDQLLQFQAEEDSA